MSYEGYVQFLCPNGHLWNADAYDYTGDVKDCDECGLQFVWSNPVDETNCDSYGYVELKTKTPRFYEKCNHCGHEKLVQEETYEIPSEEETKRLRGE